MLTEVPQVVIQVDAQPVAARPAVALAAVTRATWPEVAVADCLDVSIPAAADSAAAGCAEVEAAASAVALAAAMDRWPGRSMVAPNAAELAAEPVVVPMAACSVELY